MRVIARATTRYWGVVVAASLHLPALAVSHALSGQAVPPAAPAAPPALYAAAWTVALDGTAIDGFAASANHLVVVSRESESESVLEARTKITGARAWISATRGWDAVAAYDDTVVGVVNGRLQALDAASGQLRWSAALGGRAPRLTLADEWLVATSLSSVGAYGVRLGGQAWTMDAKTGTSSAGAIDPAAVTIGFDDGSLDSFDLVTGQRKWSVPTGSPPTSVVSDATLVYTGLANGSICAFRARDGRQAWCRTLGIPAVGLPLIRGGRLLVVLRDNTLRVFDARTGTMTSNRPLGYRPASGIQPAGDHLVVPLASAAFLVLDRSLRTLATIAPPMTTTTAQLFGTVVAADGALLASLTIPPGGRLTLTAYRPSGAPSPPAK
jgi:outer membrane protein assembly factor BamB